MRGVLLLLGGCCIGVANAEPLTELGRYLPLYPAMYFSGTYSQDPRDSSYDQNGNDQPSAAPQSGQSSFPLKAFEGAFTWHFPLFESYGIPYISSHNFMARVTLRYATTATEGALKNFIENNPRNDDVAEKGDGIGDTTFEYGTFLYGAQDWRTRAATPLAILLLGGVTMPTGVYERDAPNSVGNNTWAFHVKLGVHWQPWSGSLIDAGGGYRFYARNEEPEFGRNAPHRQGSDRFFDLAIHQRVWQGLYAGAGYSNRKGRPNEYRNPAFTPNPPAPPATAPPSDNFPTAGVYYDRGMELSAYAVSLQYFLTQRWLLGVAYNAPISGNSGQFTVPYSNRRPAGCIPGATSCQITPGASVLADGFGPARVFSSDSGMVTLRFNFGQGDFFTCTGCER